MNRLVELQLDNNIKVDVSQEIADEVGTYKPMIKTIIDEVRKNFDYVTKFGNLFEKNICENILIQYHQTRLKNFFKEEEFKIMIAKAKKGLENVVDQDEILKENKYMEQIQGQIDQLNANLENNLQMFVLNLITNLINLFKHLDNDKILLKTMFLKNADDFSILEISLPMGDIHKLGGGVSILKLKQNNDEVKLVHKTSSVKMDYIITGKTTALPDQLKTDLGLNTIPKSFFEILNTLDVSLGMRTYIVIPIENQDISLSYGYIEFIKQDDVAPETSLNGIIGLMSQNAGVDEYLEIPDGYYDIEASDSNSFSENEMKKLAKQTGVILGTVFLFKSTDLHLENVLIENKLPVIIDLENSFNYRNGAIGTALSNQYGGLNYECTFCHFEQIYFLKAKKIYQINNQSISNVLAKNFYKKHGLFASLCCGGQVDERLVIDQSIIIKGFNDLLKTLKDQKAEFKDFYESLTNVICREVPLNTQTFMNLKNMTDNDYRKGQLESEIEKNNLPELFKDGGIVDRINNNLKDGFIPSFYFDIGKKLIFGANGEAFKKNDDIEHADNYYFAETPISVFLGEKNVIEGEDNDTRKKLVEDQNKILENLLEVSRLI